MPPADPRRPAVFIDRDDTLIENHHATASTPFPGDLFDPALVTLLPGSLGGCRALHQAGFVLVVVSNQGGLAAGRCTLEQVEATNDRMRELLRDGEGSQSLIDGVYLAPARPSGMVARFNEHPCWRKPDPGMLHAAAEELQLDLNRSWMIGDADRDIEAGLAAGLPIERCIRVGPALVRSARAAGCVCLPDFQQAARHVLAARRA